MQTIDTINHGGFGVVERVRLNDGTVVARKTFNPAIPIRTSEERQKLLKRFNREVRFQSSFDSEAICPILDSSLTGDSPWFTMPLAEKTLVEEMAECKANGTVPSEALADILNALEVLHELGYVHRDLKPQNVLLIDGRWKLTDFGLVLPPSGTTTRLTSVGSAWGTPEYAAPEQSAEFHALAPAADIYAYGCILHDIFGTPPRVPYAKQTAAGRVGAIIERCTEIRADRRFVSIKALRAALLDVLSTLPDAIEASSTASDWAQSLRDGSISDTAKFEEFARYLRFATTDDDQYVIFKIVDEDAIENLYSIDRSFWKLFIADYCEWVSVRGFDFAFCDVLVQRLEAAYELGDTEIRAAVVLASAELGSSHNRWYVMGRVFQMCGPDIDDNLAARICVDIRAFEAERNFQRCADVINKSYSAYHPQIAETISEAE